jgi:hypothetical protein
MKTKTCLLIALVMTLLAGWVSAQDAAFNGKWTLLKHKSSDFDYFREVTIEFAVSPAETVLTTRQGPRRPYEDRLVVRTDGRPQAVEIQDGTFATNLFMGLKLPVGGKKEVTATWVDQRQLRIEESFDAQVSQGTKRLKMTRLYELDAKSGLLTCRLTRSSRRTGPEVVYVYKRADADNAFYMKLADDWDIGSKLPEQACLISLQGIVNANSPRLYFTFGPEYPFNYTEDLRAWLESRRNFTFTQLGTLEDALRTFKDDIKGYIVWDKEVRTSLIVAYTLAGLEKGIVISADLIPLAEKYGLRPIDDFRGRFTGKSDYEIYSWAKERYWARCSRDVIVWLGGVHGTQLMPACADYGMLKQGFCSDLSNRRTDTQEYELTKSLYAEMKPLGQVWGWHSYKKDMEEEMTSLLSCYALTSDGLNTMPNTSFLVHVPVSPGFVFKNHHNLVPGRKYVPEKKVYLALIQTDGLGIGAWLKPGRGSIPYAWEVTMKFINLSPAMLEYYYDQATPNDYFIGSLSGSSYCYPKAFPKEWLPKEIAQARTLMEKLDLRVFEIMDYAGQRTEAAENNLPLDIVDAYYANMPDAIGFVNGYYAANTFTVRDGRPFLSYDYYLPASKSEAEAAADLQELALINDVRPYFLLVHVRENSDVARVKSICDKLGQDFEILPLDIFLKMAGENPTYRERFLE